MTTRAVDLSLRRALRCDAERLAAEHPRQTRAEHRERCAAWLSNEPNDSDEHEPRASTCIGDEHVRTEDTDDRRTERPASRDHRRP